MTKPLIILGAGGHASVLMDMLLEQRREIIGVVCPSIPTNNIFKNVPHLEKDDDVLEYGRNDIKLVNGIGSLPGYNLRSSIFNYFVAHGFEFETVVSQKAIVSTRVVLAQGVQIMSGAVVQAGVVIGSNSIVNTGAIIDHDCNLGCDNHVAPGVTLSGGVVSKENVHFGTGSSVIQQVQIGGNAVVGAGAVLTKNLLSHGMCYPPRVKN